MSGAARVVDRSVVNLLLHVPYSRELETRSELAVLVQPYYTERLRRRLRSRSAARARRRSQTLGGSTIGVELDSLPDFYLGSTLGGRLRDGRRPLPPAGGGLEALLAGEIAAFMGLRSQVEAGLGSERGALRSRLDPAAGAARDRPGPSVPPCARTRAISATRPATSWPAPCATAPWPRIFAAHGVGYQPPPFA